MFLFHGPGLITGEVPRTADLETGMAIHQAPRPTGRQSDPLTLDDQALMVHTGCTP